MLSSSNYYVLKLSGEALLENNNTTIIDPDKLSYYVREIKQAHQANHRLLLVIGGGNIWRGSKSELPITATASDQMGMIATLLNGVALAEALTQFEVPCKLYSSLWVPTLAAPYHISNIIASLEAHQIVIVAGGTGRSFCTTDTAAVVTALEISATRLIKATQVDGIFDKDPHQHVEAKRYKCLESGALLEKKLQIMDLTALTLLHQYRLPMIVYQASQPGALLQALAPIPTVGSWVKPSKKPAERPS